MKRFFFIVLVALVVIPVVASAATVRVLKGDSLWGITEATGRGGDQWRALYSANPGLPAPEKVGNKIVVWIKPGQVLNLPDGWETDKVDTSKLEVIPPTPEPQPSWLERVCCRLAEFWGWILGHPWSWGLLGLLGLFGLIGRRQVQVVVNNHCPTPPAPPERRLITVPDCRISLRETPAGLRQVGQVRYDL